VLQSYEWILLMNMGTSYSHRNYCSYAQVTTQGRSPGSTGGCRHLLYGTSIGLAMGLLHPEHCVDIFDRSQNMVSVVLIYKSVCVFDSKCCRLSSRHVRSSRVSYVAQIIVESSMITWIATLIYASACTRSPAHIYVCLSFSQLSLTIQQQDRLRFGMMKEAR
jgi:hypothetical protein